MDWKAEVLQLRNSGKSWTEIAQELKKAFPELSEVQVREKVRTAVPRKRKALKTGQPVGIFSDPHIPFNHPNYLQFCIDTFQKYNVGQIVCCGDLVDFHSISRHQKETCAKSACDELDMSLAEVKKYTKAFPKAKLCIGNHDLRIIAQAATVGIDRRFLKSFDELLGLPKTWEIAEDFIIDDVLYTHGINCTGKNGALNAAIQERMSTVIGHSHSFGGCQYSANPRDIIFGLNVGCGIDIKSYAFAYGKHAKYRPTLGVGVVFSSGHAEFIPMSEQYFRD